MAFDEQLAERIRRGFGKRKISFEEKRMMGGLCFMVDSKMCVGVEKNRLMARIDPDTYDDVLRRKGCVPMDFTGRPMRGFVFVNFIAWRRRVRDRTPPVEARPGLAKYSVVKERRLDESPSSYTITWRNWMAVSFNSWRKH